MRKVAAGCVIAVWIGLFVVPEARAAEPHKTKPIPAILAKLQVGVASWYGDECAGNPTASGEKFDKNGLTAAHRELPLGTWIRVTNLANNRSLVLRINDRGPGIPGRLLDVSMEAARRLRFVGRGLTEVRIEVVGYSRSLAKPMKHSPPRPSMDEWLGRPVCHAAEVGPTQSGCPTVPLFFNYPEF